MKPHIGTHLSPRSPGLYVPLLWLLVAAPAFAQVRSFDEYPQRRARMLTRLAQGDNEFAHVARYVLGKDVGEANAYFAKAPTIDFDHANWFVRAWYHGRPHLDQAARDGLLRSLKAFRDNFARTKEADFPSNPKAPGPWTENHQFRHATSYVLMGQILEPGRRHGDFAAYVRDMLHERLLKGFGEYDSPKYLHETCEQLTALANWSDDPNLKTGARMLLDVLWADVALTSLRGVRGGPAVRLASNGRGDTQATDTLAYEWGGYYFGWRETDKMVRAAVDGYAPPAVVFALASDVEGRGTYELKNRNWFHASRHEGDRSVHDFYYFMHPAFGMGTAQNRMRPQDRDRNSVQTWEVATTDPDKSLGGYVPYIANSRGSAGRAKPPGGGRASTANLQYRNVIFFSGDFLDYKGNLGSGGGASERRQAAGGRELHLFRVAAPGGEVFVAVTDHPEEDAGIVEVRAGADCGGWEAFVKAVEALPSSVADNGRKTGYTSTLGDRIECHIVGDGGDPRSTATVNGRPFPLAGYAHYDSPYLRSEWGAGTTTIRYRGQKGLVLDYRDKDHFQRAERDAER